MSQSLLENVQWALVGELYSGTVYQAQRDLGAFCNGHRCQVSETSQLEQCLAGMNFDGRDPEVFRKLLIRTSTNSQCTPLRQFFDGHCICRKWSV